MEVKENVELHKSATPWQRLANRIEELSEEEKGTQALYRKLQGILNKLTPQKFQTLAEQALQLDICSEERLRGVVDKIFIKALEEPNYSLTYANLCKVLSPVEVEWTAADGKPRSTNFRRLLLTKCQQEFEGDKPEEQKELADKLPTINTKNHRHSLNNIQFIGEFFKLKMLSVTIIHECVSRLLHSVSDEESLECLARLITTTGKGLDSPQAKQRMDSYFTQLDDIIRKGKVSARIKFLLQNVQELRSNNWVPRSRHGQDNTPKFIDQIHAEARAEEEMTKQMTSIKSQRKGRYSKPSQAMTFHKALEQRDYSGDTVREQGREIQRLTAENLELRNELEIERVKALTFQEDFHQERRDRESAHTKVAEMEIRYTHQLQTMGEELHRTATELNTHKQDLTNTEAVMQKRTQQARQQLADRERDVGRMNQEIAHLREEVQSKAQQQVNLQDECTRLRQQLEAATQEQEDMQQQSRILQQRLDAALAEVQQVHPVSLSDKSLTASRKDVEILSEIGRGAWGTVAKGKFQGQLVAVKCPHPAILDEHTVERLRREVKIMARVRHPNLLQFIGAVFDNQVPHQPPLIILELLDMNLRMAYQRNRLLGSSKIPIFRDVAYALHYLHEHQEPIIHRDVSAPNVLLEGFPNGMWRAKVSDFGSANLARLAQTMGEGAIIYAAPETIPQARELNSPPPPQTTKIDVYSYGVLLCEVINSQLPNPDHFWGMLQQVQSKWPFMYEVILSCLSRSPEERPTMAEILDKLNTLPRIQPI